MSLQTRQDGLQLVQHNSLLRRTRIPLAARHPNTNTSIAPARAHHRRLSRQPRRPARLHVRCRSRRRSVDARQDELEARGRGARRRAHGRVVDVEPCARGQVRRPRGDERLRDVGGERGVDGLVGLGGGRPGDLGACRAAEGEAGDAFFGCLCCGAYGA